MDQGDEEMVTILVICLTGLTVYNCIGYAIQKLS